MPLKKILVPFHFSADIFLVFAPRCTTPYPGRSISKTKACGDALESSETNISLIYVALPQGANCTSSKKTLSMTISAMEKVVPHTKLRVKFYRVLSTSWSKNIHNPNCGVGLLSFTAPTQKTAAVVTRQLKRLQGCETGQHGSPQVSATGTLTQLSSQQFIGVLAVSTFKTGTGYSIDSP